MLVVPWSIDPTKMSEGCMVEEWLGRRAVYEGKQPKAKPDLLNHQALGVRENKTTRKPQGEQLEVSILNNPNAETQTSRAWGL